MSTIPTTLAQAMLQRGRILMVEAVLYQGGFANAQRMFDHWKGFSDCAALLLNGGAAIMALHDQASDPQSISKMALAGLPNDCERLTFTKMEDLVRAQGIDLTAQAVTDSNVNGIAELQDGVGKVVKLDDEHAVTGIDVSDSGQLHTASAIEASIVSEGGAA